jgi:pimeloyl-ACP methyl ester carboxylesterase
MVLDGVINPPSYASFDHGDGDVVGPETTSFLRILSNQGSADALQAFFDQCAAAGPVRCAFAAPSAAETREKFNALMDRLRTEPMVVQGLAGTLTVTYSLVDTTVFIKLYAAPTWSGLAQGLQRLEEGDAAGFLVATGTLGAPPPTVYPNSLEGQYANNCLDTDNPHDPARYPEMARQAEARTPYFGTLWTYMAMSCAFWPAEATDRYAGPWDAETSAPILLISRVYDPATPHGGAVAAAETLANARLLTIDGWGHGYYLAGRSTCADDSMAAYLIDLALPPVDTVCPEDVAPFSELLADEAGTMTTPAVAQPATPAAASPVAADGDFAGLVDIGGGRRLYLECAGEGSPTVLLEAGYRSPATVWTNDLVQPDDPRTMVFAGASQFTRVCAYERPGAAAVIDGILQPSRSDPVPMPRSAESVVADLHALLRAAEAPGPYVLVGHSLGGLFVRLYAATYPDEVVGLVLVDAWSEGLKTLLTPKQWEAYVQFNSVVPPEVADDASYETLDFAAASEAMATAANAQPLPALPLVVLAHGQPFGVPASGLGFPPETLESAWRTAQEQLAMLVPDGRFVIAEESAHYVQLQQPELVVDAIREVVEAVRDPSTWEAHAATPAVG